MSDAKYILALRISLEDVEPEVWRRLLVPYDVSLRHLHEIFQAVMGWDDEHLFEFHFDHGRFGTRHPEFQDGQNPVRSIRSAVLNDQISPETNQFHYIYDIGDYWVHEIVVEEVLSNDTNELVLQCVGGEYQCPPEDIGGAPGYETFLEAIADHSHEERAYYLEVYGDEFDPVYFSLEKINDRLNKIRKMLARSYLKSRRQ